VSIFINSLNPNGLICVVTHGNAQAVVTIQQAKQNALHGVILNTTAMLYAVAFA